MYKLASSHVSVHDDMEMFSLYASEFSLSVDAFGILDDRLREPSICLRTWRAGIPSVLRPLSYILSSW